MSDWEDDPEEPDESEMDYGDSTDEAATDRKPIWLVLAAVAVIAAILLRWVARR